MKLLVTDAYKNSSSIYRVAPMPCLYLVLACTMNIDLHHNILDTNSYLVALFFSINSHSRHIYGAVKVPTLDSQNFVVSCD